MNSIQFILVTSTILWLLVDWVKPMWENLTISRYLTMGIAAVGAVALVITFDLDLLVALNLTEQMSVVGKVFAAMAMTAGSGLINEIIKAISNSGTPIILEVTNEPEE